MAKQISLACLFCDREDYDDIDEQILASLTEWEDVAEADISLAQDAGAWWTHLGCCPDCKEKREEVIEHETQRHQHRR